MNQPMQVFLQSLMAAGLDFVTVVNKIFSTKSRRNNLNYTSMFELEINCKHRRENPRTANENVCMCSSGQKLILI